MQRTMREAARTGPFEIHDPSFLEVLGDDPRLVMVADVDAHEGPVYVTAEDALYFTTPPRFRRGAPLVAIKRLQLDGDRFPLAHDRVSVVRGDANVANGMTLDNDGRLLVCEQGTRSTSARISRLEPATGESETVVDSWRGRALNSPNDIAVRADGSVWFTDPSYGHLQGFRPRPEVPDRVYRYDRGTGELVVVAEGLKKPNGISFSPDERILYVTDSGANEEPGSFYDDLPHHTLAFDVAGLSAPAVFSVTRPGFPDGIKTDDAGRVYVSALSGVQVFDATGRAIGEMHLPGAVNFTFGGPGGNVLFITTDDAVWAAVLEATGARKERER